MEAIGVAELGLKLLETTHDLVKLCGDINRFPGEVNHRLEELIQLDRLLREDCALCLQDGVPEEVWERSSAKRSFDSVLSLVSEFISTGEEFQSMLANRKGLKRQITKATMYSKRRKLEELQTNLDKTLSMHQLALRQWDKMARNHERKNEERLLAQTIAEVTALMQRAPEASSANGPTAAAEDTKAIVPVIGSFGLAQADFEHNSVAGRSWYGHAGYHATGQGWAAYFRAPAWLTQRVWELRSYGSVGYNLRTYNVVPKSAAVFTVIKAGNVPGLQGLFSSGAASPLDRDEDGNSLLFYAVRQKQADICHALLKSACQELVDDRSNKEKRSPLDCIIMDDHWVDLRRRDHHECSCELDQILRSFATHLSGPNEIPAMRLLDCVHTCSMDEEWVTVALRSLMPKYYQLPLRERLEVVRYGSFTLRTVSGLQRLWEGKLSISTAEVTASVRENLSIVHSIAIAFGKRYAYCVIHGPPWLNPFDQYQITWDDLVVDVARVASSDHLHSIETITPWADFRVPVWRGTPLVSLIGGVLCKMSRYYPLEDWDRVLQKVLRRWLECLQEAGVDLMAYGKGEKNVARTAGYEFGAAFDAESTEASRTMICPRVPPDTVTLSDDKKSFRQKDEPLEWMPIRLVGLEYGEEPSDWKVWWAPDFETWAGEFWHGVASMRRAASEMPGAWRE